MTAATTLPATFWEKVRITETCWLWLGAVQTKGYGSFSISGVRYLTHRLSYEDRYGPIPDGLQIDHLCRVRQCINPAHLETVTTQENTRRGRTRDPRWLELVGAMAGATSEVPAPAIATFGGQR